MKKFPILFMILLFGCTDSEENASTNLRKGDEFFNKGEYEIAEYYYDKIPEESILYKSVERKKIEIEKIAADPTLDTRSTKKLKGVFITNHTFQINNLGILPLHTITVMNSTDQNLQVVELEFIYYDDRGKEVKRLTTVASTPVPKNTQKTFTRISPGMVDEKFVRANVVLEKPVFY